MKIENFIDIKPYEQPVNCSNQDVITVSHIPSDSNNKKNFNSSNFSRRRANSLRLLKKQHLSIIKPIALRPNQTSEQNTENLPDSTSLIKSTKFASIDKLNEVQRRNSFSKINYLDSYDSLNTVNSPLFNSNYTNNQPQRPHLNFIKMKLQQIRIANTDNQKILHSFNSLDLDNCYVDDIRNSRKLSFASNSSLFSSLSSSSSIRTELSESDLDLAQIENDLNY